jgi:hypothetical protein
MLGPIALLILAIWAVLAWWQGMDLWGEVLTPAVVFFAGISILIWAIVLYQTWRFRRRARREWRNQKGPR